MKISFDTLSRDQLEQTALLALAEVWQLRKNAAQETRFASFMLGVLFGAAVSSAAFFVGILAN